MRIAVVYCYPNLNHLTYDKLAQRFTDKFIKYAPGISDHTLHVVANGGGKITPRQERLFHPLVPQFMYHDNSGRDLGAYMMAARTLTADLLVCLGAPVRPCREGWLDTVVHAVENNGPGLYGFWGFSVPTVHLQTTAFCIAPQILQAYPIEITNERRYQFEHGTNSITAFTIKTGFPVMQVTARGAFPPESFRHVERDECLLLDQFDKHYGYVD